MALHALMTSLLEVSLLFYPFFIMKKKTENTKNLSDTHASRMFHSHCNRNVSLEDIENLPPDQKKIYFEYIDYGNDSDTAFQIAIMQESIASNLACVENGA